MNSERIAGLRLMAVSKYRVAVLILLVVFSACTPFSVEPKPGPDKQFVGTFGGATIGAGMGAVLGHNIISHTAEGAWVGTGFGLVFGMLSGLGIDLLEEDELRRLDELDRQRELLWVQEVLAEHYARRLELHPNRDIFPADWFFEGDSSKLKPEAVVLSRELGNLTQKRMPWSRIVIASYITSRDPSSAYAEYVTEQRAQEIALQFVKAGIEPRRVLTQGLAIAEPVLIDPDDSPGRYRQAIEIIPLDP